MRSSEAMAFVNFDWDVCRFSAFWKTSPEKVENHSDCSLFFN
jgi:hypothetical protein